jgi:uncharacterized repeat protein (TIGR02543 family)
MKNIKIKSIIKKLSLALLVLTAFTFTACENSFSKQKENKASVGYLKIVLKDQLKSRTVLPDLSTSNLTDIHLSVLYDGETEYEEIANWANASKIKNVALEPCSGYFKLTATCNGCTFQDTKYAEIYFAQISPVAFTLYTDASYGGLDLKISFPQEAAIAELSLINEYSGNVITPSEDLAIQGTSGNHYVQYTRDLHDSSERLEDGTYFIEIKFYGDSSKTILLNTYYELIRIRNGFISSATRTIDLNNLYTITYYSDGGSPVSGTLQQNYSMHSGEIALPALQKAGFIFEGWYDNPSFTGSVKTSIPAGSSGPLKYYALFTIELKEGPDFNTALNTWQTSNPEKIVASLTAPDDSITISQYLDTGTSVPVWYDSAEHSIKYFADGYTNGTKRLKMRPDSNSMFKSMGQSMQIIEISVFDTSAVINMSQMFFGNINLEAIYVSSAFTTDTVENSTDMFASCSNKLKGEKGFTWSATNAMDKTYAKIDTDSVDGYFCSNPASEIYYITYHCGTNPDGTNAASNPVSYTENTLPINLSAPARTKVMSASLSTAYQFVAWYKNADYSGDEINSISEGTTGNLNLYAKWKTPYRVEHSFENAADSLSYDVNDTCTELYWGLVGDATQAVPLTDASYSGSITLPADINGFEAITPVSQKTINDNGETITTVKYNRKEFTITYDLNGGNISGSTALKTQTGKYGTAVPALTGIKKAGYTLTNWKNSSDGTIGDLPETFPAENRTYIAQWTPITYQIVYELDDGAFVSGYPETAATTYKVTEETTLPAATQVTKDYMHLEGWYDNASFTGDPLTELTENSDIIELADANNKIHLYAKWALDPVSLTVTPGFPGNYICKWSQILSGSNRTINISVTELNGSPIETGTTTGSIISDSIKVDIYEGVDFVKTENTLSFTYPSYLGLPSGTPFYVKFNIKVDDTTAYSYDYWPEEVPAALGGGLYSIPGTSITANLGTSVNDVFNGRELKIPMGSGSRLIASDHEVTQDEYTAVMGENPSNFQGTSKLPEEGEVQENRPVEMVNWYDAIMYCNKKSEEDNLTPCYKVNDETDTTKWGYTPHAGNSISGTITCDFNADGWRLPTEVEWEYLARGGDLTTTGTAWSGTTDENKLDEYAWYSVNASSKTHEVKKKKANSFGLYDMSGNVYEWCWDWYGTINTGTDAAGVASGSEHVTRGGSWNAANVDFCTVSDRYFMAPGSRSYDQGFRVVRSSD